MNGFWRGGLAIVLGGILMSSGAALAGGTELEASWDKGIRLSGDGYKLKLGGRIMNDWAWISADDSLEAALGDEDGPAGIDGSGTEFRRARLYVSGEIDGGVIFKAQYDFAGGDADFKDMYVGLKKVGPLGTVRVGHFKEPFSLEELTSSKVLTFMERSLPNAFAPGRNTGFGFMNAVANKRVTYAAGVFREADDFGVGFGDEDDYDVTGRITALPLYGNDGRRLVHLGVAYSRLERESGLRFRARPETHLSPVRFVDTGGFDADGTNLVGLEAATVLGPLSVQGEYLFADAASDSAGDPTLGGFYVYTSFFLTGENRAYKDSAGAFDRVKPGKNFRDGGIGALEAGLRFSSLDLEDAGLDGGELNDVTAGLNWYLNPNTRVMFNYVFADLDGAGEANIAQARFQIDF